jgi:hypothetical protein
MTLLAIDLGAVAASRDIIERNRRTDLAAFAQGIANVL